MDLIVEWVQRSVKDMGTYTFNSSAILTLERIESGLEFCLSDSSKRKIIAGIECVRKQIESKDLKYGRLEHFSSNSHPLKGQMKERGLKIGLKGENEIVDNCKFCLHCCYRQKFLHKDWYCEIRKDDSKDSIDGNLRVIPSYNSCGNFERRRPSPMSLSKSKLMQYGIIQYAISQGYCYVDRSDIESFGVCKHCAHYIEQNRCQEEGCALRGRGDGYSSKRCCCKSFVPLFPDCYIKLRED